MNRYGHLKSVLSVLFFGMLLLFVYLEVYASNLAYENFGGLFSGLLFMLIFLNVIPAALFIFNVKKTSAAAVIIIGLMIIPVQLITLNKLLKQKEEAANIVNFAYREKIVKGGFPEDLSKYEFKYPELKERYTYEKLWDKYGRDDFQITYWTGTPSTSHFYNHSRGPAWMYYDD